MTPHAELDQALSQLESTLRSVDLWNTPRPDAEAFDSREPFCVDTMELPQWLRYVFMARLQALVDARGPLPATCQVAPAAEAYLQNAKSSTRRMVIEAVAEVDRIVTEA
ncbi:YqcC family protein [Halomonas sp. McH1-25]|uniref:YqcC family protein n=1 Tax=unclassified Halomonas TaxID=2609666 RepID=UPI001EF5C67E|nr:MULTISPECIES: YqcC family protein [unclassified Halomonas]MCG7600309.1 YqcC family protein [Halomonas sp. McH1-25]MCP1342485.1 YqcC family protein [Halomonas sp. FL8]MCP1359578.1 YqcC family protein [Halomonas sp. BBD45]MCP1366932.1 YqcC family protein [Halomonas sp. BBD48]